MIGWIFWALANVDVDDIGPAKDLWPQGDWLLRPETNYPAMWATEGRLTNSVATGAPLGVLFAARSQSPFLVLYEYDDLDLTVVTRTKEDLRLECVVKGESGQIHRMDFISSYGVLGFVAKQPFMDLVENEVSVRLSCVLRTSRPGVYSFAFDFKYYGNALKKLREG